MSIFALNLVLMIAWVMIKADGSGSNFILGFILGWLVLSLISPMLGSSGYFKKPFQVIGLILYFIMELWASSLKVLWDILTPEHKSKPDIIKVPLTVHTDTQILLLSNLLSLTPGTLTVDITPDKKFFLVHAMFLEDEQALIDDIKDNLEKRILEVTES